MTPQNPIDLLEVLATRCRGEYGTRPTARALLDELDSIDWDAQAALLQSDLLRAAGWKVEEHPRFVGRQFVYDRFDAFAKSCRERGGVFVVQAPGRAHFR